jgi:hypothetical protein
MEQNIHIKSTELTDQEVLRHKDFSALMNSYRLMRRPVYRRPWFVASASMAGVAAVICILYFTVFNAMFVDQNTTDGPVKDILADHSLMIDRIAPPLEGINVVPGSYKVNSGKASELKTPSGTKVSIPANAFEDNNGKKVQGDVDVRIRELNDPIDFFLAGIPMHYDSANQLYQLESMGMIEVLAYQSDQQVFLQKDAAIEISMASAIEAQSDVYFFDTSKESWINIGKNNFEKSSNGNVVGDMQRSDPMIDSTKLPAFPRLADQSKKLIPPPADMRFSDFPELAKYKNVKFHWNENYCKYDNWVFKGTYQRTELRPSEIRDNYYLSMTNADTTITIMVYPVFEHKDYQLALKLYNEERAILVEQANNNGNGQNDIAHNDTKGVQRFSIHQLGLYMAGSASEFAAERSAVPVLSSENGDPIEGAELYMAEKGHNTLYCYGASDKIYFEEGSSVIFWIVTPDGKIGMLDSETFTALTKETETPEFKLTLMEPDKGIDALRTAYRG